MKKVLFILVLMMASFVVYGQTKTSNPANISTMKKGQRIQLPGVKGEPIYYRTRRPPTREEKEAMNHGTVKFFPYAKMPTSMPKKGVVRTAVETSSLPKPIIDNIATDFAGYTIKDATKVVTHKEVSYEVFVTKESTTEVLVYEEQPAPK
jgi:hypothetical protein